MHTFVSCSMSVGALVQYFASWVSVLPSYGIILRPTVDHTAHTAPYGTYCYGSRIFGQIPTVAKGPTHEFVFNLCSGVVLGMWERSNILAQ
jgi:hypothetical protein